MGRVKTKLAKGYTKDLMKMTSFTSDYEQNKKIIDQISSPQSKKIRNIVAGYITRLSKQQ